ncbi:MAG: peptide-methionine (R)-S-oxide reductase MsrB [Nitriliruptorales bacterium]|nr:peptide-methionine (R)-S-oxide reductase MsrB [Nitriliruptorales bacterium]
MSDLTHLSDDQWRERLTPEQYNVLRGKGTERAFTGAYWDNKDEGLYRCAACDTPLFKSETKYDSGSGWPSFFEPLTAEAVRFERDTSYGMMRTEVLCGTCGGHLGHLFDDGPEPTGQRYCMNSVAMDFEPSDEPTR